MPDTGTLQQRHNELDRAIQAYVAEATEGGIVLDWALSVERDNGEGRRSLLAFFSPTMTAWKCYGFARWIYQRLTAGALTVLDAGG